MKARIYGIVGSVALLASFASACRKDPTASGVGAPSEVILDFSALRLSQGDSATIQAKIVDNRLTPLEGDITFSSCDGATATVTPDGSFDPVPPLAKQATVKALGANATCVIASAAGAKPDSVSVVVLPTSFAGVFTASANSGTILTIASTSSLKFDPATVGVTFASGSTPPIISKTADQLQVIVPVTNPGPITITGVVVTYVPGLIVTLPTVTDFTQADGHPFAGEGEWQTAPDITSLIPAAGDSTFFVGTLPPSNPALTCADDRFGFGPSGKCSIYKFTLAAPATISFTMDWDGGSGDADGVICSDSTLASFDVTFTTFDPCAIDGLNGAGSSKPELAGGVLYPAGTYWFVAQDFDGGGVLDWYITIKVQ